MDKYPKMGKPMGPGGKFLHGADAKFFHQYQNKRETNKITYKINIFSYEQKYTNVHKHTNPYECTKTIDLSI